MSGPQFPCLQILKGLIERIRLFQTDPGLSTCTKQHQCFPESFFFYFVCLFFFFLFFGAPHYYQHNHLLVLRTYNGEVNCRFKLCTLAFWNIHARWNETTVSACLSPHSQCFLSVSSCMTGDFLHCLLTRSLDLALLPFSAGGARFKMVIPRFTPSQTKTISNPQSYRRADVFWKRVRLRARVFCNR